MGGLFSRFCRDDENTRTPRVTPTITVELDEALTQNLQSPDYRRSKRVRFDNKIQVLEIETEFAAPIVDRSIRQQKLLLTILNQ